MTSSNSETRKLKVDLSLKLGITRSNSNSFYTKPENSQSHEGSSNSSSAKLSEDTWRKHGGSPEPSLSSASTLTATQRLRRGLSFLSVVSSVASSPREEITEEDLLDYDNCAWV